MPFSLSTSSDDAETSFIYGNNVFIREITNHITQKGVIRFNFFRVEFIQSTLEYRFYEHRFYELFHNLYRFNELL